MSRILLIFALLLCLCLSGRLQAHEFEDSGTITLGDGLLAGGNWNTGPTTLSWEVFHPGPASDCSTSYSFFFEHPATDTFEFFFEVHENMNLDEIFDVNSTLPNYEIGYFDSSSHPGLPDQIYGYRFWGDSGSTFDTITFASDFPPLWGDFFSSGLDTGDYAWNEGFLNPDPSPFKIGIGSFDGHNLAPGGEGLPIIPEPSCPSLLLATFLFLFGRYRRVN